MRILPRKPLYSISKTTEKSEYHCTGSDIYATTQSIIVRLKSFMSLPRLL